MTIRTLAIFRHRKAFGWYQLRFNIDRALQDRLKRIPGIWWNSIGQCWMAPRDALPIVELAAKPLGYEIQYEAGELQDQEHYEPPMPLYEYQSETVDRTLQLLRMHINFEMGLGKTPTAVVALATAWREGDTALIVCPAVVRRVWVDELKKWWRDYERPSVYLADTGKAAKACAVLRTERDPGDPDNKAPGTIVITSYELLSKLPATFKPTHVVADESHYLKNPRAGRSKSMARVLERQDPVGLRLFLTGTPIDNEPLDLWNQAELLVPGSLGKEWHFKNRYCLERPNGYSYSGKEWYGLNPVYAEELRVRLAEVSARVTKREVAHLLPPLTVSVHRVAPDREFDIRELLEEFSRADVHNTKVRDALIRATSDQKLKEAVELASQATGPVVLLTHFRDTAQKLGDWLNAPVITGDLIPKKRHEILDTKPDVLCATMHSLSTGLSLTHYTNVVYAELDWRPSEVIQSMARYHRVSGNQPVNVTVLVLEGTLEERVANSVLRKLGDVDKLIGHGAVSGKLSNALEADESEEDFYASLQVAAGSMLEADGYI